jgi:hypothetical protein
MVGLNITRMTGLEQTDIDQLRGSGRKVADTVADLLNSTWPISVSAQASPSPRCTMSALSYPTFIPG